MTEDLSRMETRLQAVFQPIRPSSGFVKTVKKHLDAAPQHFQVEKPPQTKRMLLVFGGVLSFSLFLLTVARAIFYFLHRARQA
jgi:hypothetical protein